MSDSDYLKCSCSHCQGLLEFSAHTLGIAPVTKAKLAKLEGEKE